jgi:cell division transport system permease protein
MIYFRRHAFALKQALRKLFATPIASLASLLVLGLVCALPLSVWLMGSGLVRLADRATQQTTLNVYLKLGASSADLQSLTQALQANKALSSVKPISREQALAELSTRPDFAGLTAGLSATPEGNPLPHVIVVESRSREASDLLAKSLTGDARVERVFADFEWVDKLASIGQFVRRIALALTVATALALAMVIINTVRLQIAAQRAEIEVSRLIGATASQVRRPFLYFGLLQGLLGGLIGFALAAGLAYWLKTEVQTLGGVFGGLLKAVQELDAQSLSQSKVPSWMTFAVTVVCTSVLGWISAFHAASRGR